MTAAAVAVQRSTADRCEIFDRCATAGSDRDEGAGISLNFPAEKISQDGPL